MTEIEELKGITRKLRDLSARIGRSVEIKTAVNAQGQATSQAVVGEYSFTVFYNGADYLTYEYGRRGTVRPENVRWGEQPYGWPEEKTKK